MGFFFVIINVPVRHSETDASQTSIDFITGFGMISMGKVKISVIRGVKTMNILVLNGSPKGSKSNTYRITTSFWTV